MYIIVDLKNIINNYYDLDQCTSINNDSNNIPFDLVKYNNNNNISCENQLITIKLKDVKTIYLLGFSEISYFNDEIIIYYKNKSSKIYSFLIKTSNNNYKIDNTEWDYINSNQDYKHFKFGNDNKLHVIKIELNNKNGNEIEYLALPYNPNIHIFSITFEI